MSEVTEPPERHPRIMLINGDNTHEGTETQNWKVSERTWLPKKGSRRGGSKSSGSFQHEWGRPRPRLEKAGTSSSSPGRDDRWRTTIARGGKKVMGDPDPRRPAGGGVLLIANKMKNRKNVYSRFQLIDL